MGNTDQGFGPESVKQKRSEVSKIWMKGGNKGRVQVPAGMKKKQRIKGNKERQEAGGGSS